MKMNWKVFARVTSIIREQSRGNNYFRDDERWIYQKDPDNPLEYIRLMTYTEFLVKLFDKDPDFPKYQEILLERMDNCFSHLHFFKFRPPSKTFNEFYVLYQNRKKVIQLLDIAKELYYVLYTFYGIRHKYRLTLAHDGIIFHQFWQFVSKLRCFGDDIACLWLKGRDEEPTQFFYNWEMADCLYFNRTNQTLKRHKADKIELEDITKIIRYYEQIYQLLLDLLILKHDFVYVKLIYKIQKHIEKIKKITNYDEAYKSSLLPVLQEQPQLFPLAESIIAFL